MIYTFVYSVADFDRNITDNELKEAYFNGKEVKKYTLDDFFNNLNDDLINLNAHWVRMIDDDKDFYSISSLHLGDLEKLGFNVSKVTENDMITLADKLSDDYCEQLFWSSLDIIADATGIPRVNDVNDCSNPNISVLTN